MLERIRLLPGVTLDAQEYLDDVRSRVHDHSDDYWTLERRQDFAEPGVPSWEAFAAGDWDRALALAEEMRPAMRALIDGGPAARRRRIRVVERPVSPYVQWEMHILRLRVLEGEEVRVLPASELWAYESDLSTGEPDERLPELVVLGASVLYEVGYDHSGCHNGARRITDQGALKYCRTELELLYSTAQDLLPYFDENIAPLPPPTVRI